MANQTSLTTLLALLITTIIILTSHTHMTQAQNCGCDDGYCCSKWGYCGTSADYCGDGCREGPCYSSSSTPSSSGVWVPDVVNDEFFYGILNQADSSCPGKDFYSRAAFLDALGSYPEFGTVGSSDDSKREIAAFFAHVTHETGHFCYIDEIDGASRNYCDYSQSNYPCNPDKQYYGRGPIQISWNYNYGQAGWDIGFDGLNSPETVGNDAVISFKTAFWFWMNNVHSDIVSGQGFGASIKAVNGGECNGGNWEAVRTRVGYYTQYCNQLGVWPGENLYC